jgi:tetratricopeptide (TPR) repeat protein
LFEAFQYDQAVPLFDRLIAVLGAGGQVQRTDLLQQTYELRGRSRFALNDTAGAEQDFSALLALNPSFKFGEGISPKVVDILTAVRKLTIGQVVLSLVPAGDVQVDGKLVSLQAGPQTLDLTAGDHQVTASRPSYRPINQKLTVIAGESVPVALTLERLMSTIAVTTVPAEVEVVVDGTSRGTTARGEGSSSAPLLLTDLPLGTHRLVLKRSCFRDLEHTVEIATADDLKAGPLTLTPTIATVKVEPSDSAAIVFLDGTRRGTGTIELANVCEGAHVIEVKGASGRYIDRRDWKTGDNVTLKAELRSGFPIVATPAVPAAVLDRLRANLDRVLAPARRVLVYFPADSELATATRGEDLPAGWLSPETAPDAASASRLSREVRRDIGRKLATRLEAQGLAAITATPDANVVLLSLLAAGSGEPDVITINLTDPASRTRALDFLGAALPPVVRATIDASVVDVATTPGAVVIRTGPSGAKAGLAVGDVVIGAAGGAIASVADLRARIAAAGDKAGDLVLEVRDLAGATKQVSGAVALAPETWPPRDASLPYNRALLDLQDRLKTPAAPTDHAATLLNLAVVQMHVANWDDALATLATVKLPEGSGVSAGTVTYFVGLCHEALGRTADAQAAFTKAAASAEARVSQDGPLVAPLAQRKLTNRR